MRSDVPVLVFGGEFDPDTPPAWGRRLLASMPNARIVELRGRSHGAGFNPCGEEITLPSSAPPSPPFNCTLR